MVLRVGTDFSGMEAPIEALKQLGIPFKHLWSCEIDKFCRQTIEANCKPSIMYNDITTRDHTQLPDVDLYVAGFPCQSFSTMGKKGGFSDPRGSLMNHCIQVITLKKPKMFILENVKNFKFIDNGESYKYLIKALENLDIYNIYADIYNTKDYGIPQNRERLYIIGILKNNSKKFFKKPEKIPLRELDDFLEDKTINLNYKPSNTIQKKLDVVNNKIGYVVSANTYGIMFNICPTITSCGAAHIYYNKINRRFSIIELLSLQGFSKNFKVVVSRTQICKQIGNSMSVNVLKAIFYNLINTKKPTLI